MAPTKANALASVMSEHNFQQPIKQCVVGDVVGIKSHLNEKLCDPEIIRRGIKNAV